MAIDFTQAFGKKPAASAAAQTAQRPKSQFWLNIGYPSGHQDKDGKDMFVSLASGIPLDGMEKLPTNSKNVEYAAFNGARNDLHDQIMAVAQQLKAGEERTLNLTIQLRRINEDAPEMAAENNPLIRKLDL